MIIEQGVNKYIEEVKENINDAIKNLIYNVVEEERNLDAYEILCVDKYIQILKIAEEFNEGIRRYFN